MKKKFTKILGAGLTLALLFSLVLTAAPVSALSQPSVSVGDPTISEVTDYSIVFDLGVRLGGTSTLTFASTVSGAGDVTATIDGTVVTFPTPPTGITVSTDAGDTTSPKTLASGGYIRFTADNSAGEKVVAITLTAGNVDITQSTATVTISEAALPVDSIIIEFDEDTDITGVVGANVTVAVTSGIGTEAWGPEPITIVAADDIDEQELTIDIPLAIGVGAMVEVVVSDVKNPDDPGDYTLDVSTSNEDAKTSDEYEIEPPDIGVLPGIVQLKNAVGIIMK
ncbi:hypothetical protein ES703_74951 [subsurface metagenome]